MTSASTFETSAPVPVCVFSRSKGKWYRAEAVLPHAAASAALAAPKEEQAQDSACAPRNPAAATFEVPAQPVSEMDTVGEPCLASELSPSSQTPTDESESEVADRFRVGDAVCVFCRSTGAWLRDGVVVKVLSAATVVDGGLPMPAGAVKVLYDSCGSAKWVPPAVFGAELKRADFTVGDAVSVLSRGMGLWVTDGLVVEVLSASATVDGGLAMPSGSAKVTYANGDMAKWIPPAAFGIELRAQRVWNAFDAEEVEQEECSTAASEGEATPVVDASASAVVSDDASRKLRLPEHSSRGSGFEVNDPVCVFRRSTGEWSRDGVVVQVLAEPAVVDDGLPMPSGAVKVLYDGCSSAKWVPPAAFGAELKRADYMVGDAVSVLCRSMGLWVTDGLVVEVLSASATVDGGLAMPAGSAKVTYANGDMAKWIPPEAFLEELQAQRQWSAEALQEDAGRATPEASEPQEVSIVAEKASSLVRGLSRLLPVGMVGGLEAPALTVDGHDDEDAYIVSGIAGVASSVLGRYRRVGEQKDRPKYRNERGAIMYFDEHWKMNAKDDTLHWCYEVREAAGDQPPAQAWAAYRFYGDSDCPAPTVARAADLEVLAVSGVKGPSRAVNGRYVEVGVHNEQPKYKNSSGAIIFFDGYWKMNDRDDVLAWRFAVKDRVVGAPPPAGDWAAHWSVGASQPPAHVRACGAASRVAEAERLD